MSPAPALVVRGPAVPRADEILTPEALEFVADLQRGSGPAATSCSDGGATRRAEIARTHRLDFLPRDPGGAGGRLAGGAGPARPGRPAGGDHRPDRAARWRSTPSTPAPRCGWPTSRTPTPRTGPTSSAARSTCTTPSAGPLSFTRPEGKEYRLRDDGALAGHRAAAARLAPATSGTCWSTAAPSSARWSTSGCYFFHNAAELLRPRQRPVLLPAQDGEPPRGAALERRLHLRRGAGSASRTAPSARPC